MSTDPDQIRSEIDQTQGSAHHARGDRQSMPPATGCCQGGLSFRNGTVVDQRGHGPGARRGRPDPASAPRRRAERGVLRSIQQARRDPTGCHQSGRRRVRPSRTPPSARRLALPVAESARSATEDRRQSELLGRGSITILTPLKQEAIRPPRCSGRGRHRLPAPSGLRSTTRPGDSLRADTRWWPSRPQPSGPDRHLRSASLTTCRTCPRPGPGPRLRARIRRPLDSPGHHDRQALPIGQRPTAPDAPGRCIPRSPHPPGPEGQHHRVHRHSSDGVPGGRRSPLQPVGRPVRRGQD